MIGALKDSFFDFPNSAYFFNASQENDFHQNRIYVILLFQNFKNNGPKVLKYPTNV